MNSIRHFGKSRNVLNIEIVEREGHICFLLQTFAIYMYNLLKIFAESQKASRTIDDQIDTNIDVKIMAGGSKMVQKWCPEAWCFREGCPRYQNEECMLIPRVRFGRPLVPKRDPAIFLHKFGKRYLKHQ